MSGHSRLAAAALLLALPCAAQVHADLSLIKRLGPDAYRDEPYDAPYLAVFGKGDTQLLFVSGDHESGIESSVAKTIRYAFETYKPQAVIVEGLKAGDAKDEKERIAQAKRFAEDAPESFPENYYPIHLAVQHKIPFAGGEPTLKQKLAALKEPEDVLALGLAAQVGYMNSQEPQTPEGLSKALNHLLAKDAREVGLKSFTWADFERWYAKRGGLGKPAHAITAMDARPVEGPQANFIQTLAYELERVREETIVRQIESMLKRHQRVLVVYGSGHLVRQRPVWKQALGPSKDRKPF